MVLLMIPFVFLGVPALSHPRTAAGGMDFVLVMLLLLQPAYPMSASFPETLAKAGAVVAAPVVAYLAFRAIFPTDARRRMEMLIGAMVRDLEALASSPAPEDHAAVWRARHLHRLLRLAGWLDKTLVGRGPRQAGAIDGALAVSSIGDAVLALHALERRAPPGARRAVQTALARLGRVSTDPHRAARALHRAAARLEREDHPLAAAIRRAASDLESSAYAQLTSEAAAAARSDA